MQLSFTTNFKETEVRLQRIEAGLPVKQRELLDALVPRFIAIQEQSLKAATPENERAGDWLPTGADARPLPDTTVSVVTRAGSNQYQSNALITTYQSKMVRNSRGDTFELSDVLVEGRNTVGKTPIRPVLAGALYSPGLAAWAEAAGAAEPPYYSVKGSIAAPNDYFKTAREDSLPKIEVAAAAGVASMSDSLFTLR